MKWYYAEGGKQIGPVEESALDDLVRQGVVRDETLVWREGLAAWQRHAAARGGANPNPAAPAPAPAASALGAGSRYCSECGRAVPASQLTSYGDVSVCTQCQPAYAQRVSGGTRHFGGFWIRFVARLIDGVLVGVALCVVIVPLVLLMGGFGALMSRNGPLDAAAGGLGAMAILGIIALAIIGPALYEIYFVSTRSATPGKLALGLKIVRADGGPMTTGLAVGRFFAYLLDSLIPLYIGFIIAGFDSEKRAVHDYICGTRVVYTR
ncbi:MAG: RDD family protein [Bryobacteraceae bacterium]